MRTTNAIEPLKAVIASAIRSLTLAERPCSLRWPAATSANTLSRDIRCGHPVPAKDACSDRKTGAALPPYAATSTGQAADGSASVGSSCR